MERESIELNLGSLLSWQRLDDKKMCRITYILNRVSVFNELDWPQMQDFLVATQLNMGSLKNNESFITSMMVFDRSHLKWKRSMSDLKISIIHSSQI